MKDLQERIGEVIARLDQKADEWRKKREGLDDNKTPRMAGMCVGMASAYDAAALMLDAELTIYRTQLATQQKKS